MNIIPLKAGILLKLSTIVKIMVLKKIGQTPKANPKLYKDIRKYVVKKF